MTFNNSGNTAREAGLGEDNEFISGPLALKTGGGRPGDGSSERQRCGAERVWAGATGWDASEFAGAGATRSEDTIQGKLQEEDKD